MEEKFVIRLVTERLILRELSEEDFGTAHAILGDTEVMYAWEHGFSEDETRERNGPRGKRKRCCALQVPSAFDMRRA